MQYLNYKNALVSFFFFFCEGKSIQLSFFEVQTTQLKDEREKKMKTNNRDLSSNKKANSFSCLNKHSSEIFVRLCLYNANEKFSWMIFILRRRRARRRHETSVKIFTHTNLLLRKSYCSLADEKAYFKRVGISLDSLISRFSSYLTLHIVGARWSEAKRMISIAEDDTDSIK